MSKQIILIVDDNPDDVELTTRVMKSHRIANELWIAHNGSEALEVLFREADEHHFPALILLDLKMPCMDGLEVLRRIRGDIRTKHLPVVIMTTSREEQDIAASYELGANSFIQKPVEFEAFAEAVRHVGLYWLLLNVTPNQ